ncbi:MAG: Uma2 family endonuclease [Thermomicrobiales bacterium]
MVATRISVAEFEATCGDDRVELVDGVVVQMPAGSWWSSSVSVNVLMQLWPHVRERKLGRVYGANTGFVIFPDRDTVLAPDGAFIRAGREPQGEARRHFARLAPDLVLETLAPDDRADDMAAKVAMYQEAGSPLVWVADPDAETVTVYAPGQPPVTLGIGDELDGGDVLPEFRVAVAEIFA